MASKCRKVKGQAKDVVDVEEQEEEEVVDVKEEEVEEQEVVDVPKLLQATLLAGLYSRRFLRLGPGQLLPRKLKAGPHALPAIQLVITSLRRSSR